MKLKSVVRVHALLRVAVDCVRSGDFDDARAVIRHAEGLVGDVLFEVSGDLVIEEHIFGVLERVSAALVRARRSPGGSALEEAVGLLGPIAAFADGDDDMPDRVSQAA